MAHYTISTGTNGLTIARSDELTKVFAHGESVSFQNSTTTPVYVFVYDDGGSTLSSPLALANPFSVGSNNTVTTTIDGHYGSFKLGVATSGTSPGGTDVRLPAARYVIDVTARTFRPSGIQERRQGDLLSFHCNADGKTARVYDSNDEPTADVLETGEKLELVNGYTSVKVKDDSPEGNFYFQVDLAGVSDGGTLEPIKGYIKVVKPEGDPSDGACDKALKAL